MKKNYYLACDFETNNDDLSVYAWRCKNSKDYISHFGTNIYSFIDYVLNLNYDCKIYFHNGSKFDHHFTYPVFRDNENFTEISDKRLEYPLDFNILTDENFKILSLKIMNISKKSTVTRDGKPRYRVLEFRDSNLLFPGSIKSYGKSLNKTYNTKQFSKLEGKVDYTKHQYYESDEAFLNDEDEFSYLKKDVDILFTFLMSMQQIIPFWKWKITSASTMYHIWIYDFIGKKLLNYYLDKELIYKSDKKYFSTYRFKNGKKEYRENAIKKKILNQILPTKWLNDFDLDPNLPNFYDLYKWYNGGLTYVNPKYVGKYIYDLKYIDINSSYPSVMNSEIFPVGKMLKANDKNGVIKLYLIEALEPIVNEDGLPFIYRLTGVKKEYLKVIPKGFIFRITDVEYKRFKKYYKGKYFKKCVGSFRAKKGHDLFGEYIKYFYDLKKNGKASGDQSKTIFSKLGLNSLYGKFGQQVFLPGRVWDYDNIRWTLTEPDGSEKAKYYLPIAIWITAYARMKLVDACGIYHDDLIYTDTDSITCKSNSNILKNVQLDPLKLGAWDVEHNLEWGLYRRTKQYFAKTIEGEYIFKYASITEKSGNIEHIKKQPMLFITGCEVKSQLRPYRLPTGIMLEEYEKVIKPLWEFKDLKHYWYGNKENFKI